MSTGSSIASALMNSSLHLDKWLLLFLLENKFRRIRQDWREELFPIVYTQQTPTNEALCSLLSTVFLRALRQTYVHRGKTRDVDSKKEGGVTWSYNADSSLQSSSVDIPVVIVLRKDHKGEHVDVLIDSIIDKGWVVAEPDLSSQSSFQQSVARIFNCTRPNVPLYLFADSDCSAHLKDITSSNDTRLHGVVAVSFGESSNIFMCPSDTIPFLVLSLADSHDLTGYRTIPSMLVLRVSPKVSLAGQNAGTTNHSILLEHEYPAWIAKCSGTFMEATTWHKTSSGIHDMEGTNLVSKL